MCPLLRRHHKRWVQSEPRRENIHNRTLLCRALPKVLTSTQFVGAYGIFIKAPNISYPRHRKIRAILGRNITTVWSSYLCPSGPDEIRPALPKVPAPLVLVNRRSDLGGAPSRCDKNTLQQQQQHSSPCAYTYSNKLLRVCLLSGVEVTLPLVYAGLFDVFVLARNCLPKLAIAASSSPAAICVSSLGVVWWQHATGRRLLAACRIS